MISNYICKDCQHFGICKVNDKVSIFDIDAKKPLGVNITINDCENFKEVVIDED